MNISPKGLPTLNVHTSYVPDPAIPSLSLYTRSCIKSGKRSVNIKWKYCDRQQHFVKQVFLFQKLFKKSKTLD